MFRLNRRPFSLLVCALLALPGIATAQTGIVSLVGELSFPGFNVTDVTGFVDPDTDIEYAIVGFSGSAAGIIIVDLSDPTDPQTVKILDGVPGFDVKVYDHYAYTVNGGLGSGAIIDISNPAEATEVAQFPSSHNITIDPRGYLYAEVQGLIIYDLTTDPTAPAEIWNDESNGGHDATILGNLLYDFHGSSTTIYDVTDATNPVELGFIDPPFISYHHSGWTTEDGQYLFLNDELALHPRADITIWDISDPENPDFITNISDSTATVHNIHIRDNLAFVSYYTAGFKVFDITDPTHPMLVGHYDTDPETGESFSGAFGVDALLPSRHVLISGTTNVTGSLHIFSVDGFTSVATEDVYHPETPEILSIDVYPNPFSDFTSVDFEPGVAGDLVMSDLLGRIVFRTNVTNNGQRGTVSIPTAHLARGVYLVRLSAGNTSVSRRVVKVD